MARGAYTYDPGKLKEFGKDRMRFELGDTMVEGGSDTAALTDEEIQAALACYPKSWKRVKLILLESLCRRLAYEVDTKTGPLTLSLQDRAKLWREDYQNLKKEVERESRMGFSSRKGEKEKPSYFYTGMQQNERGRSR